MSYPRNERLKYIGNFFSPEKSLPSVYIMPSACVVDASNKLIFQQLFAALQTISLLSGKYLVCYLL